MAAATNKSHQRWEWRHFREVMCGFAAKNETRAAPLLEFFGKCDRIVGRILSRPLGIDSDRPQDYVIAILSARAFRLTTGAVRPGPLWVPGSRAEPLANSMGDRDSTDRHA
jgi:hypothetical protein